MKLTVLHNALASKVSSELLPDFGISEENLDSFTAEVQKEVFHNPHTDLIDLYAKLLQIKACSSKALPADGRIPEAIQVEAYRHHMALEEENRRTNSKILAHKNIEHIRHLIAQVLPPVETVWESMWQMCDYGPGATFLGSGPKGRHIISKIGGQHSVTRRCSGLYLDVIRNFFPRLSEREAVSDSVSVVKGNRLHFVPKTATKCRTIAIEPSCNMFLQKGICEYMVRRLRRFGLDLRDQERNKVAAWSGSMTGELATIDLSDASSRITTNVVRNLLPPDWFALLDTVRSPGWIDPDGSYTAYEMFSSQGNAFTFPLETLIFWAICKAAGSDEVIVYGDDIIIESKLFSTVSSDLEYFGFKVNTEKSFATGFFRESCGGDYIDGVSVRPVYYKQETVRASQIATLHNLLWERWGMQLRDTLKWLRSLVPEKVRVLGPPNVIRTYEVGSWSKNKEVKFDSWFIEPFFAPRGRWHTEWQTFVYSQRLYAERSLPIKFGPEFDTASYLAFLHSGSDAIESSSTTRHVMRKDTIPISALRSESCLEPTL